MSAARGSAAQLGEEDCLEWLASLSLVPSGEGTPFRELIRDGVILCHLVNKIRPGSIETVSFHLSNF